MAKEKGGMLRVVESVTEVVLALSQCYSCVLSVNDVWYSPEVDQAQCGGKVTYQVLASSCSS